MRHHPGTCEELPLGSMISLGMSAIPGYSTCENEPVWGKRVSNVEQLNQVHFLIMEHILQWYLLTHDNDYTCYTLSMVSNISFYLLTAMTRTCLCAFDVCNSEAP